MRFLLLSLLLSSVSAQAGFIRLASSSSLMLKEKNGQIWMVGEYVIENQGDEVAKDVSPSLRLDDWTWNLKKRNLAAGETTSWKVSEKILDNKLCNRTTEFCIRALPRRGDFFLRVDKSYQDQNSYPFSTPEVLSLTFNKGEALASGADLISASIRIKAIAENEFQADYKIANKTKENLKLGLHFLFPQEVSLTMPRIPVDLRASGDLSGTFYFKNISGLTGSDYLAMMVIETVSKNERRLMWIPTRFKIESAIGTKTSSWSLQLTKEKSFFALMGVLSVLGALLVIFYWEIPRRRQG